MLSPARDGYATVLTYWEALAGERMSRHFSLLPFVSCFPNFFLNYLDFSEIIVIFAAIILRLNIR